MKIEGIYSAYMTGVDGNGFSMFIFSRGIVVGADPLGVKFEGIYERLEDGYSAQIVVSVPSNGTVIQGVSSGATGFEYKVSLKLQDGFEREDFVRIETPLGPVNLKLELLKALDQ